MTTSSDEFTPRRFQELAGMPLRESPEEAAIVKNKFVLRKLTELFVKALDMGISVNDLSLLMRTAYHDAVEIAHEKEAEESKHELGDPRF